MREHWYADELPNRWVLFNGRESPKALRVRTPRAELEAALPVRHRWRFWRCRDLFVAIMCKKLGPDENGIFYDLPFTDFNVRWYHVYSTIAFLVANLWNFQLNRLWTFRSAKHSGWFREYFPSSRWASSVVGLGILTLLMHPNSIFSLSQTFFDNSTGFRTRFYWAQLITIAIVTPLSFLLNKFWTFSAVRGKHGVAATTEDGGERASDRWRLVPGDTGARLGQSRTRHATYRESRRPSVTVRSPFRSQIFA